MNSIRDHIRFFDWFKMDNKPKEVNMLKEKILISWQDGKGRVIERIHHPFQEVKIPVWETQVIASPLKVKSDPPEVVHGHNPKGRVNIGFLRVRIESSEVSPPFNDRWLCFQSENRTNGGFDITSTTLPLMNRFYSGPISCAGGHVHPRQRPEPVFTK